MKRLTPNTTFSADNFSTPPPPASAGGFLKSKMKIKTTNWLNQTALAYEVRMTSCAPDAKWRSNHVILAIAGTSEEAISMCKELYPDDPIIDQVVLRNRGMDVILSSSLISAEGDQ